MASTASLPSRTPRRPRRRAPVLWLPSALWSVAAVSGLVWLAGERQEAGPAPTPPAVLAAPPSPWQPLPNAAPVYALEGQEARILTSLGSAIAWSEGRPAPAEGEVPLKQEARRHEGGGREDVITLGASPDAAQFRLEIRRGVPEPAPTSFYIDVVRRAAEAGLAVVRAATPVQIATKFGPVEAAPALFEGRGSCLAFRFAHPDLAFRLSGWLCGPEGRPVDEEGLVCAIDRLVLAPGVQDPALRVLFAQAERRRTGGCAPLHFAGAP